METPVVALEADLKVLGRSFVAAYQRDSEDIDQKKKKVTSKFLFAPQKDSPVVGMSLKTLVDQINEMRKHFLGEEQAAKDPIDPSLFTEKLDEVEVKDPPQKGKWYDTVTFTVVQAFFYYEVTKTTDIDPPPKGENKTSSKKVPKIGDGEDDVKKDLQYAFQINVDTSGIFPGIDAISLDGISLAFWSCKYKKILDTLQILDIDSFLTDDSGTE